ncbi:MAG: hypothetical protein ACE5FH_12095 [Candidatus Zixiibacteriota bacterium]
MKRLLLCAVLLTLCASLANAGESSCPADRAAKLGHSPIADFHDILAPTWHEAWPSKDYDALLEAGPKFAEAFVAIAKLEPTLKTDARMALFTQNRDSLKHMVDQFATAAKSGDKDKVYQLMPDLHDAFEMTASSLLPISYPEFDGMVITLNLIRESHLPKNNMAGIIGSTETLVDKFEGLSEKTIPADLVDVRKELITEFAAMKEIALKAKSCCDKGDMDNYREHIDALGNAVDAVIEKYI